ncbi:MAG: dockerin type I domain-containing protein [Clostridia bacterium]|nr:dockerin type I domain-containing protein [Clostridia bacterium]
MKHTKIRLLSALLAVCILAPVSAAAYTVDSDIEPYLQVGEALYMENAPAIDGYYSAEEWGEGMTYSVYASDPALAVAYETGNVYTRLYSSGFDQFDGWKADICLRWDENYLYAAVMTNDPDTHVQNYFGEQTNKGDSLSLCIDSDGYEEYQTPSMDAPVYRAAYSASANMSCLWYTNDNEDLVSSSADTEHPALIAVAPCGSDYTDDTKAGITTYEMAIPWESILFRDRDQQGNKITSLTYEKHTVGRKGNYRGGIGFAFGFSMALTDSSKENKIDANLIFGKGCWNYFGYDKYLPYANALFLSGEKAQQADSFKTYDPADINIPYVYDNTIDAPGLYFDYLAGDYNEKTPVEYSSLTTLTYETDDDLMFWGAEGRDCMPQYNIRQYDSEEYGYVFAPNADSYSSSGMLSSAYSYVNEDTVLKYPMSYTLEFDLKYSDNGIYTDESWIGNLFGGNNLSLRCGYFPSAKQFRIVSVSRSLDGKTRSRVYAFFDKELVAGRWYNWKFQYDSISKTVRLWLRDKTEGTDDLIFNLSGNNEFVSAAERSVIYFVTGLRDIKYDNVKIYNFSEPEGGTPEALSLLPGDVNCDKKINAVDSNIVVSAVLGNETVNLVSLGSADINFDKKINAVDSNLLRKKILGTY